MLGTCLKHVDASWNTARKHFENISKPVRKHVEHISNTFRKHFEHVSNTVRKHFENVSKTCRKISNTCRTDFEHISKTFRKRVEHMPDTFRTRFEHTSNAVRTQFEHVSNPSLVLTSSPCNLWAFVCLSSRLLGKLSSDLSLWITFCNAWILMLADPTTLATRVFRRLGSGSIAAQVRLVWKDTNRLSVMTFERHSTG